MFSPSSQNQWFSLLGAGWSAPGPSAASSLPPLDCLLFQHHPPASSYSLTAINKHTRAQFRIRSTKIRIQCCLHKRAFVLPEPVGSVSVSPDSSVPPHPPPAVPVEHSSLPPAGEFDY